jgi:hypothetical protein
MFDSFQGLTKHRRAIFAWINESTTVLACLFLKPQLFSFKYLGNSFPGDFVARPLTFS